MKMMTNLLLVFVLFIAAGVSQASTTDQCSCPPVDTAASTCSDYDVYIKCLVGVTVANKCTQEQETDAAVEKRKAEADKLSKCSVKCTTCTPVKIPTCSDYSSHLNCLKNVTVANHCADTEVSDANDDKEKTQAEMSKLKCSGASNLVNSVFLILMLSLMTRTLNGN